MSPVLTLGYLWSNILNLQTANLLGISNLISPIFNMGRFIMFRGLSYYIVTRFCMKGLNVTEAEEATLKKANVFQFENESPREKSFCEDF